ncbi:hydroxyethylthiazole kinase [Flexivirga meconopsidis]|uniref:hydroxyethylthiazole kinase n=1 Tax=Flexivirga meconopsidis TaxID=2977121 RepID=UPI0022408348
MSDQDQVASLLARLRQETPLVQCITNSVVTGFTANVLLALGAAPAMVDNREEAPVFAGVADGVLINLGTLDAEVAETMQLTAAAAGAAGTPWVLDPVAVGGLPLRDRVGAALVPLRPSVIRGNASEVISLSGADGGGRGVDSTASTEAASDAATSLARRTGGAVAVSGPVDRVVDGSGTRTVANGTPMMTKVTGVGCALGAMVAAFAPYAETPAEAAFAATAVLTIAAELADEKSDGPGTFAVQLLDALHRVGPAELTRLRR